jgi:dTDP-4-amino-4,6-dideoxygalactose transaminase
LRATLRDRRTSWWRRSGARSTAAFVGGAEVSTSETVRGLHRNGGLRGVASGTNALRFAYQALGAGGRRGSRPNTFIATTEALTQAGATIRFVDGR